MSVRISYGPESKWLRFVRAGAMVLLLSSPFLRSVEVLAQPVATPETVVKSPIAPLDAETRATIGQAMNKLQLVEAATMPIDLKVSDATIDELVAQVKKQLPTPFAIEIRGVNPARFTLQLQATSGVKILQAVATLAGSKLYLLSDHFLIASQNQLSKVEMTEGKEWDDSVLLGNPVQRVSAETHTVLRTVLVSALQKLAAQNAMGHDAAKPIALRLSELPTDLQQVVQAYIDQGRAGFGHPKIKLSPDTIISFEDSPSQRFSIKSQSQSVGVTSEIPRQIEKTP